jgi:hypothetical protein
MARAFWTVAPGQGELREEAVPPPGPGELRLRAIAGSVSRGTERLVFTGRVPPGQYAAMRGPLQAGDFPFPVKYGYAVVAEGGPADNPSGRVFCLHPHQDAFNAPAAMCVAIPDGVPSARAVLGANMETALNILWDAAILPGQRVLVIGAGVVGLLAAWLAARIPGCRVTLCDLDPGRAGLAAALGCDFCAPDAAPADQDAVIEASASPEGLVLALDCAGFEARITVASWFGDKPVALPLGGAFHARRLSLVSSQVGAVAPAMRGRRTHAQRMATALALLADPALDALLAPPVRFEDLPREMPRLLGLVPGPAAPPCPVIQYRDLPCSA